MIQLKNIFMLIYFNNGELKNNNNNNNNSEYYAIETCQWLIFHFYAHKLMLRFNRLIRGYLGQDISGENSFVLKIKTIHFDLVWNLLTPDRFQSLIFRRNVQAESSSPTKISGDNTIGINMELILDLLWY